MNEIREAYDKLKDQAPCEDEYIKVPKKALKYRTAGMVAYNAEWLKNHFDIERAVIFGAQEPCEDAVSRAEIKNKVIRLWNGGGDEDYKFNTLIDYITELLSVTPTRKKGKWIKIAETDEIVCEACNYSAVFKSTFCPHCGAEMENENVADIS